MTAAELRSKCGIAMASMKAQIEARINPDPIFMFHWPLELVTRRVAPMVTPGEWSRLPFSLGPLLDDGRAKTILFQGFRDSVARTGADATIFATTMWRGKATKEGMRRVATKEWEANVDRGFDRLVKLGWAEREETVTVIGQTAADVVMMMHAFRRRDSGPEWIGELQVAEAPQSEYAGRTKMFGEFNKDTLGEPPEGSYADRHNKGEE